MVISLDIPNPPRPAITVRVEIHDWLPAAGEADRVPALEEALGCSSSQSANIDPRVVLDKLLALLPGAQEKLGDAVKFLADRKNGPALRLHMAAFVPALATLVPPQPGQPPIDGSAPLVEVEMNVVELSPAAIPDSVFTVPAGYMAVPLDELMKAFQPGLAQAPASPAPAAPARPDFAGPVTRPGNGVSNPIPINKPEPRYSEEARKARVEGTVMLSLVVDPEGNTRNIKVVRSLEPSLDQKAIEAVSQWKFKPGLKDGTPVAVQAQIEVTFRLLDNPPDVH